MGGRPGGMAREYPQLYLHLEHNLHGCHVVTHEGRIVAHTGVYPLEFVIYGRRVLVGGIGAVSTHEKYRGQGLMSVLLHYATDWMRTHGMPLSILWGEHLRYARFGWVGAGGRLTYGFSKRTAKEVLARYDARVVELTALERAAEELHALHRRLPLRVERSAEVFPLMLKKIHRRVFVALQGQRILAYAVARSSKSGKGRVDWSIEEVVGSGPGILSILRWLVRRPETGWVQGELPLVHRDYLKPLLNASDGWSTSVKPLGQIKVVDEDGALKAFRASAIQPALRRLRLSPLDRVRLLFGPLTPYLLLPHEAAHNRLAKHLPLPFYLWPTDHV